ncbi:MAG: amylosucrase [Sediminibacterium sp.]
MYQYLLHQKIKKICNEQLLDIAGVDHPFYIRFIANANTLQDLFNSIYGNQKNAIQHFDALLVLIIESYKQRKPVFRKKDQVKEQQAAWFTSNQITGMSLYVDRFAGSLKNMPNQLPYLQELGVNFLHLMPLFESPEGESDGGYAVSDFRKIDARFGTLNEFKILQEKMQAAGMYLMIDIVLNHTSHHHEWALKAKAGDKTFQDYYYMYDSREIPNQFDATMPEIFPESSPGSFTFVPECNKWAMTVFHNYQWDLNYTNPVVFNAMLSNIFFCANLGVDILRIDAPAFIWKQLGTTCQNLPEAHTLLRLIKQCVHIAAPGMAILGEAIVAPKEIMKYFGTDAFTAKECDVAYNATQMALQWDALATGDTRVMLAAQHELSQKPFGTTWITYTRCHDDIGLGYDDSMIAAAGFNAYEHRKFLKEYYSGSFHNSPAIGALFSVNPKTQDARISGSLASLCGLEKAIASDAAAIDTAIAKIILMQAQSMFLGGIPMLFYGDEVGYTNDYSYLGDPGKSYDNRWMHRPIINWEKNALAKQKGTIENRIFNATQKLIQLRKSLAVFSDTKNITWLSPHNIHVAGFIRYNEDKKIYCLFNFNNKAAYITWFLFKEHGLAPTELVDHWSGKKHKVGSDHEYLVLEPYQFAVFEIV